MSKWFSCEKTKLSFKMIRKRKDGVPRKLRKLIHLKTRIILKDILPPFEAF